jgi:hypothetical protein
MFCQDIGVIRAMHRKGVLLETEPKHTGRLVHMNVDVIVCGKHLDVSNRVKWLSSAA